MIKQLEKIRQRNDKEFQEEQGIDGLKLLLENNAQEELQALRALGMTDSIDQIENKKGRFLQRQNFEKDYGRVFTEMEIKELCINYNLRFLKSKKYTGPIDAEIGAKIVSFCKKSNITLSNNAYGHDFFIVAPKEYFNLDQRKRTNFSERMRILLKLDPLLFYKVSENNYALVWQWGNTFTYLRYIKAFFNRSSTHSFLSFGTFVVAALTFLFSLDGFSGLDLLLSSIVGTLATACFYGCATNGTEVFGEKRLYFSDEVWDSSEKG